MSIAAEKSMGKCFQQLFNVCDGESLTKNLAEPFYMRTFGRQAARYRFINRKTLMAQSENFVQKTENSVTDFGLM